MAAMVHQGKHGDALVSVIVPTLNGARHLEDCLPTLATQSYSPLEILVVDNGSTDDSQKVVERFDARWVPLDRNYGFAPALTKGIEASRGRVLLFVNNDMKFDPDFVSNLAAPILRDDSVFATDARQLDWQGKAELHGATRLRRRRFGRAFDRTGSLPLLDVIHMPAREVRECFQACGGNMAVDRAKLELLGGLDDRLVAGWEDTDLAWRSWARGWRTLFIPSATCEHQVGATSASGEGARMRLRGSLGGRLLFTTKYLPLEDILMSWSHAVAGLLVSIVRGPRSEARQRLDILREQLKLTPQIARERRVFYEQLGLGPREFVKRLTRIPLQEA
jgi:GT2 family glycosyltransferase